MQHWTRDLRGGGSESGLELHGPDAERVRRELGSGAMSWAERVGIDIANRIADTVPRLREGTAPLNALRRATTSTTLQALTLVAGIGEPDTALATDEVEEIAADFARRGIELNDLLRAIRVGYAVLASALLDAATELTSSDARSNELRRIAVLLFEELDDFTGEAASAFLHEQAAWVAGVSAERLDLVNKIIEETPVEVARTERVLDYSLSGHQLALIVWCRPQSSRLDLRRVVDLALRQWGTPSATLIVPVGAEVIWAWGHFTSTPRRRDPGKPTDAGGICVAVGQVARGLDGFRDSHVQARAVRRLVDMRSDDPPALTTHEDVALEVLLLSDPDAAAEFVARTLGSLADSDPRTTDARTTLRRYLELDHSLVKVAAVENISKNTVTYRVQKALQLCGHVGTSTTDIRAALRIHGWLAGE